MIEQIIRSAVYSPFCINKLSRPRRNFVQVMYFELQRIRALFIHLHNSIKVIPAFYEKLCIAFLLIASLWSLLATLKPSAIVFLHY